MSSIIEIEAIQSEIASIDRLLCELSEGDLFGRMGLEYKKKELERELGEINQEWRTMAEVVLYFGGNPVLGSDSIKASFASSVLSQYQELISALYASFKVEDLSESGPIPFSNESSLSIAGTPRGSFGFILKGHSENPSLLKSTLSEVVDEAATLLHMSSMGSDDLQDEIGKTNSRVLKSLQKFIDTLSQHQASINVKTRSIDVSLTTEDASRAYNNITNITIEEKTDWFDGIFRGATADSRRFDFASDARGLIKGRISPSVSDEDTVDMTVKHMNKRCKARLIRSETKKTGSSKVSEKWTLLEIQPIE